MRLFLIAARRRLLSREISLLLQVVALAALGLASTGCNQVFGLTDTDLAQQNIYPCDCVCSANVTAPGAIVHASPGGVVAGLAPNVNTGVVLDGPELTGDGKRWWLVDLDTGPDGWIEQPFLQTTGAPPTFAKDAKVCLPAAYNADLGGTPANLTGDVVQGLCSSDVVAEASSLFEQKFDFSVFCSCDAGAAVSVSSQLYETSCSVPCPPGVDVCLVEGSDPPVPTPEPFSAALFQPFSECEVSGSGVLVANGHRPKEDPRLDGTLEIRGRACPPGAGCNVGVFIKVNSTDLEFDSGTIFASDPKFVELSLIGSTEPGVIELGPFFTGSYLGEVPAGSAFSSTHGRRSGTTDAFVFDARNNEGLALAVTWDEKFCRIGGDIGGQATGDGGEGTFDVSLDLGIEGPMINQPPRPDAGLDQTVECTSPSGAPVTLDASGSIDLDSNLALYEWRRGAADGTQLVTPSLNPVVQTQQALGTESYYLLVADSRTSADGDSVAVNVVDTTGAEISCNAPSTIRPRDVQANRGIGISFTATAQDLCNDISSLAVQSFSCTRPTSCKVALEGAKLTILDPGGVGDVITWIVAAQDSAGNSSQKSCSVTIVNKM